MQLEGANRSIACSVMVLVELTGIAVEAAWDIVERLRPLAFVHADMWQSLLRGCELRCLRGPRGCLWQHLWCGRRRSGQPTSMSGLTRFAIHHQWGRGGLVSRGSVASCRQVGGCLGGGGMRMQCPSQVEVFEPRPTSKARPSQTAPPAGMASTSLRVIVNSSRTSRSSSCSRSSVIVVAER